MLTPSTFHVPWVVVVPLPTYDRLLAALGAADVDAVDLNAGGRLEDDPRVAGRRDALELDLRDDRPCAALAHVENWALAGDHDLGRHARELERDRDLGVLGYGDRDVRALDGREAAQRAGHDVAAVRAQVDEPELTAVVRHGRDGGGDARKRHRDARKGEPLLVGDLAEDVARLRLAEGEGRREQERRSDEKHRQRGAESVRRPCR